MHVFARGSQYNEVPRICGKESHDFRVGIIARKMMRRTNHRPAFLSALAARQGFARVIVVVLASVYRYHSRGIARVGESKIVRAPFDEHHKQKCHRQYDVEFPLRCLRTAFEHKYVNTQCNNQGFQFSRGVSSGCQSSAVLSFPQDACSLPNTS